MTDRDDARIQARALCRLWGEIRRYAAVRDSKPAPIADAWLQAADALEDREHLSQDGLKALQDCETDAAKLAPPAPKKSPKPTITRRKKSG